MDEWAAFELEDRLAGVAVEALAGNGDVAVLKQMRFDDDLEGGLGVPGGAHAGSLFKR